MFKKGEWIKLDSQGPWEHFGIKKKHLSSNFLPRRTGSNFQW